MRTTLDVDESLVGEVMALTGARNRGSAVNVALREYVRRRKLEGLRKLIGSRQLLDNWRELEDLELQEAREQLG